MEPRQTAILAYILIYRGLSGPFFFIYQTDFSTRLTYGPAADYAAQRLFFTVPAAEKLISSDNNHNN